MPKRHPGKVIRISHELWRFIVRRVKHPFEDTPDIVLRRELGLLKDEPKRGNQNG